MLWFLFAAFGLSYDQCPPGIAHLSNTATNVSFKGWYFFYSEYIPLGDELTVRINPTKAVDLYVGKGLKCPSEGDGVQLNAKENKFSKTSLQVSGDPGLTIFGIYTGAGSESVDVVVSVVGKNPNNSDKSEWVTISSIFLAFCFVLLILLFVHAILARGRVHYQVEVEE